MKKLNIIAALALMVFAAGCVQQPEPVSELIIPGHGSQVYTFASDIHEALKVKTNDAEGIKRLGNDFTKMNIVFNGANETDNAYFRVVLVNFMAKVPVYYSYEGKYLEFDTYYYIGDVWYNYTGGVIPRPEFTSPVLWLVGPSEATDTSVNLIDNKIYLSGTDYKNLTLAGDKLTLLFFNIDRI